MSEMIVLVLLALVVLALAWIDGGRVEQRPVVQPVELPAAAPESGG